MIFGIILAAGESRRMGSPKPLLMRGRFRFLETAYHLLRRAGVKNVGVVLGAKASFLRRRFPRLKVRWILNRRWRLGQLSSLQAGLRDLSKVWEGVFVLPVDYPMIKLSTCKALLRARQKYPERIIIPQCGSRGGHPVIFPRRFFGEIFGADHNTGAREVVYRHPRDVFRVAVRDRGIFQDIDTPEDYARLVQKSS